MTIFVSTYVNKVDCKGRVSTPAQWRSSLTARGLSGIVCFPSFRYNCLEGLDDHRLEKMAESLDHMDIFSDEQDSLAQLVFASARCLGFDGEGRILLPNDFRDQVGITTHATFVGRGKTFQIWNPEALDAHAFLVRDKASRQHPTLKLARGVE